MRERGTGREGGIPFVISLNERKVFNKEIPLAERLIFRKPKDQMQVTITAEKNKYTPGAK